MASHQTPPHQNHRDWVPGLRWVGTGLARRRLFFETHASHMNGNVPCPACGYPTLGRRGNYDCCSLCHWEDDGHDEPCEDQPNGGPNDSSLSQARVNLASTYSAWSWAERDDFSKSNQAAHIFHGGSAGKSRLVPTVRPALGIIRSRPNQPAMGAHQTAVAACSMSGLATDCGDLPVVLSPVTPSRDRRRQMAPGSRMCRQHVPVQSSMPLIRRCAVRR